MKKIKVWNYDHEELYNHIVKNCDISFNADFFKSVAIKVTKDEKTTKDISQILQRDQFTKERIILAMLRFGLYHQNAKAIQEAFAKDKKACIFALPDPEKKRLSPAQSKAKQFYESIRHLPETQQKAIASTLQTADKELATYLLEYINK